MIKLANFYVNLDAIDYVKRIDSMDIAGRTTFKLNMRCGAILDFVPVNEVECTKLHRVLTGFYDMNEEIVIINGAILN